MVGAGGGVSRGVTGPDVCFERSFYSLVKTWLGLNPASSAATARARHGAQSRTRRRVTIVTREGSEEGEIPSAADPQGPPSWTVPGSGGARGTEWGRC